MQHRRESSTLFVLPLNQIARNKITFCHEMVGTGAISYVGLAGKLPFSWSIFCHLHDLLQTFLITLWKHEYIAQLRQMSPHRHPLLGKDIILACLFNNRCRVIHFYSFFEQLISYFTINTSHRSYFPNNMNAKYFSQISTLTEYTS